MNFHGDLSRHLIRNYLYEFRRNFVIYRDEYMDIPWILQISSKFRQHFCNCIKFRRNLVEFLSIAVKRRPNFVEISSKYPVSESPSRVRLCPSCLRRFGDLRKNTPWNCGACILWILSTFVDFRVHQVVNSSTTLHLYAYLCVLAPPWSYSISEIRNPQPIGTI